MKAFEFVNTLIAGLFFVCYFYQLVYMVTALFRGKRVKSDFVLHNYAVLIAARNESAVIADLIASIKEQMYPKELITVFVVADNCTDNTAAIARNAGAVVFERENRLNVGKGYALDFLLKKIGENYPDGTFDGYFVFDADNVLEADYIYEMNRTFSQGYEVVTGYRNSKNYGDNWISAGYGLWFLRESQFLNKARYILGTSCFVSGTGFMFSDKIIQNLGGWKYYLLTEDLEFTADNITKGVKIGYCETAMLYDEQPVEFKQSVRQRLRWGKGYFQVLRRHGADMAKNVFVKRDFSSYDMLMSMLPAMVLSIAGLFANFAGFLICIGDAGAMKHLLLSTLLGSLQGYMTFFLLGLASTVTEWKKICCPASKKILYMFTFPLFMITYLPISIAALFTRGEWKPIAHTRSVKLSAIKRGE